MSALGNRANLYGNVQIELTDLLYVREEAALARFANGRQLVRVELEQQLRLGGHDGIGRFCVAANKFANQIGHQRVAVAHPNILFGTNQAEKVEMDAHTVAGIGLDQPERAARAALGGRGYDAPRPGHRQMHDATATTVRSDVGFDAGLFGEIGRSHAARRPVKAFPALRYGATAFLSFDGCTLHARDNENQMKL